MTETHTPPVGANNAAPTDNVTVPAGTTGVVVRKITVVSGKKLTIGLAGILRVL